MKKIIASILTLCMALQFSFTVSAQTNYALVDFSSGGEVLENMAFNTGSDSAIVAKGDGYALQLKTSSTLGVGSRSYTLGSAFSNSMYYDGLKVTVSYYDEGNGHFIIQYTNHAEVSSITDPIRMTNTGELMEKTFTLYDFSPEHSGISINLYNEVMSQSAADVYIKSLKLEKTGKYFPAHIEENVVTVGNQFFTGETPSISLKANNYTSARIPISYEVVITDVYGNQSTSYTGTTNFTKGISSKTITLANSNIPYGVYDATIKIKNTSDSDMYREFKTNFSMSVAAEQSDDFCVNVHTGNYTDRNPAKSMPLVRKMGCDMVRTGIPWSNVETSKGVYSLPQSVYDTCTYASQNDIEILLTLNGNNSLYHDSEYQNYANSTGRYYFPQSEESIKAFGNYVAYVVGELKGKVKHFMIWNEFEGTCFNRPTEMYRYAALLKEAYKRAKEANPDCVIIGGSGMEPILSWAEEYFNYNGANMSDAVAFHLYKNWVGKGDHLAGEVEAIFNLLKKNYSWQHFPMWVTESGFSTAIGLNTEDEQYANAIRLYIMAKEKGVDKYFYYDFKNDRIDRAQTQGNFGCIYMHTEKKKVPYSAKPSFVAFANMNNLLAKAEIVSSTTNSDGVKIYNFLRPDGKNVWVMWTGSKTKISTTVSTGKTTLANVDQYGNRTTLTGTNGNFTVTVSEIPTYLVEA